MPVYAVVTDVELRSGKPSKASLREVRATDGVPFAVPMHERIGLLCPECVGPVDRATVHGVVLLAIDVRFGAKALRYRVLLTHRCFPVSRFGRICSIRPVVDGSWGPAPCDASSR